jgi:hypothetical protein
MRRMQHCRKDVDYCFAMLMRRIGHARAVGLLDALRDLNARQVEDLLACVRQVVAKAFDPRHTHLLPALCRF